MAENSAIEWTRHTWNPWTGCTKVSEGCKYCYMYREKERYKPDGEKYDALTEHQKLYYDPTLVLRSEGNFKKPLAWHKKLTGQEPLTERLVFTCSYSDFFHEAADGWRPEAFGIMRQTPDLIYQIVTKRPERICGQLPDDWWKFDGRKDLHRDKSRYKNIWLGTTVELPDHLERRFYELIEADAEVNFLSIEPLLGDIAPALRGLFEKFRRNDPAISSVLHWVIVGGESGNDSGKYRYRPCELEWIQNVVDVCKAFGVPVFVKQLGTYLHHRFLLKDLKGGDWREWPEALRVRQFPFGIEVPPPKVQPNLFSPA